MYWKLLVCFSCLVVFIGCSDRNQKTTPTEVAYNQRVSIEIPISSPTITKVSFEVGGQSVDFDGEALVHEKGLELKQEDSSLAFTFPSAITFRKFGLPNLLQLPNLEDSYSDRGNVKVDFSDGEGKVITTQEYAPYGSVVSNEINVLVKNVGGESNCESVITKLLSQEHASTVSIKPANYLADDKLCFANLVVGNNETQQVLGLLKSTTISTNEKTEVVASRNILLGLNNGENGYDPTCDEIATWLKPASKPYNRVYRNTLIERIKSAQEAFEGADVTVALIGGGVSTKYLSVSAQSKLSDGYNFINNSSNTDDDFQCEGQFIGHDTHVAQIIHDIAPLANIVPLKVCDEEGDCSSGDVNKALLHLLALQKQGLVGKKVIVNLSLGGPLPDATLHEILRQSKNQFLVLASAGNHPDISEHYPADYAFELDNVLSVAATGQNNNSWELAPFNRKHTLKAPGVNLCPESYSNVDLEECPVPSDTSPYGGLTGTSFAAPVAAGLAALYAEDMPLNQIPKQLLSDLSNP